jgi:hypothetical protein
VAVRFGQTHTVASVQRFDFPIKQIAQLPPFGRFFCGLVSCPRNNRHFVAIKLAPQGGRRERVSIDTRDRSSGRRTAVGPFSSQPAGPEPVGCFSALLSRPVSSKIWVFVTASPARSALKNSQLASGKVPAISGTGRQGIPQREGLSGQ